jgi:hypothetical protein
MDVLQLETMHIHCQALSLFLTVARISRILPYSCKDKQNTSKDAFNFFLSQLHICIEQAFG